MQSTTTRKQVFREYLCENKFLQNGSCLLMDPDIVFNIKNKCLKKFRDTVPLTRLGLCQLSPVLSAEINSSNYLPYITSPHFTPITKRFNAILRDPSQICFPSGRTGPLSVFSHINISRFGILQIITDVQKKFNQKENMIFETNF